MRLMINIAVIFRRSIDSYIKNININDFNEIQIEERKEGEDGMCVCVYLIVCKDAR